MQTIYVQGEPFDALYSPEQIDALESKMAKQLNQDYADKRPLFLCVLNGAALFGMDLYKKLTMDAELSFVRLKSYEGEDTTGRVRELISLQVNVRGRDVIIVEDIVDTGTTLHEYKEKLKQLGAADVKIAALFYKPGKLIYTDAKPDYCGEAIGNAFIIGYGFDIDEHYRNLNTIYAKRQ